MCPFCVVRICRADDQDMWEIALLNETEKEMTERGCAWNRLVCLFFDLFVPKIKTIKTYFRIYVIGQQMNATCLQIGFGVVIVIVVYILQLY